MPKMVCFRAEICGFAVYEKCLLFVLREDTEILNLNPSASKFKIRATPNNGYLSKREKDRISREPADNKFTCPNCGHRAEIGKIHTYIIKKMFGRITSKKKSTVYKGCKTCFHDYTICYRNPDYIQMIEDNIGKPISNVDEILRKKTRGYLYEIIDVYEPKNLDSNLPITEIKKGTKCEKTGEIKCDDILYCITCGTISQEARCIGCGVGL